MRNVDDDFFMHSINFEINSKIEIFEFNLFSYIINNSFANSIDVFYENFVNIFSQSSRIFSQIFNDINMKKTFEKFESFWAIFVNVFSFNVQNVQELFSRIFLSIFSEINLKNSFWKHDFFWEVFANDARIIYFSNFFRFLRNFISFVSLQRSNSLNRNFKFFIIFVFNYFFRNFQFHYIDNILFFASQRIFKNITFIFAKIMRECWMNFKKEKINLNKISMLYSNQTRYWKRLKY